MDVLAIREDLIQTFGMVNYQLLLLTVNAFICSLTLVRVRDRDLFCVSTSLTAS